MRSASRRRRDCDLPSRAPLVRLRSVDRRAVLLADGRRGMKLGDVLVNPPLRRVGRDAEKRRGMFPSVGIGDPVPGAIVVPPTPVNGDDTRLHVQPGGLPPSLTGRLARRPRRGTVFAVRRRRHRNPRCSRGRRARSLDVSVAGMTVGFVNRGERTRSACRPHRGFRRRHRPGGRGTPLRLRFKARGASAAERSAVLREARAGRRCRTRSLRAPVAHDLVRGVCQPGDVRTLTLSTSRPWCAESGSTCGCRELRSATRSYRCKHSADVPCLRKVEVGRVTVDIR